jgi:divalent metal cation (Fe/Co/Zn/Cd) transporter
MAATLLAGLALNALLGWCWADPIAALGIVYFLVREGREAWNGEDCCDECGSAIEKT